MAIEGGSNRLGEAYTRKLSRLQEVPGIRKRSFGIYICGSNPNASSSDDW